MARPTKHNWEEIKRYYESGMPQADICKRFSLSSGRLSENIKKGEWVVSEIVTEKAKTVERALEAITEIPKTHLKAVNDVIEDIVKKRKDMFDNSALANQSLYNLILSTFSEQIKLEKDPKKKLSLGMSAIPILESHSKTTAQNKSTLFGKQPEAQTNVTVNTAIQNSIQNISEAELTEIAERYGIVLKD